MSFSRREFLRRAGLAVGAVSLVGAGCADDDAPSSPDEALPELPAYSYEGTPGPETLFSHGVASGDPGPQGVIIWTRVSPAAPSADPVDVWFEVALDADFNRRVDAGWFVTDAERDYTVKVDVDGLKPGQTYYYRFMALGRQSVVGRTRTTPVGDVERLRFGVVSCASYTSAYFHAYGYVAARHDLDAVIHLGDYIYEYGPGGFNDEEPGMMQRAPLDPPHEIISLEDYRRRYACYRLDQELQECHRQHPFILIWDDHETANNSWPGGAQNHTESTEGSWEARKAAAFKAYFEWLPVRDNDEQRIWRTIRYGDLMDLILLDTRMWGRDQTTNDREEQRSEQRTLLGADQEAWLTSQLQESTAQWRVVGQQVMLGHLKGQAGLKDEGGGTPVNNDQWDGYEASRDKFFSAITQNNIDNVVVLTGDIHTSWAMDLHPDPNNPEVYDPTTGEGSLAVEFVTPGISSSGLKNSPILQRAIDRSNPHIKWYDLEHRGYIVLDISKAQTQATWFLVEDATQAQTRQYYGMSYTVKDGQNRIAQDDGPLPAPTEIPAPAP